LIESFGFRIEIATDLWYACVVCSCIWVATAFVFSQLTLKFQKKIAIVIVIVIAIASRPEAGFNSSAITSHSGVFGY
jgi:hypothetical protein